MIVRVCVWSLFCEQKVKKKFFFAQLPLNIGSTKSQLESSLKVSVTPGSSEN